MFLHDSDHRVWNQTFEYEAAWWFVRPGGVIASDDVEWGDPPHRAWSAFIARHALVDERHGHFAFARKPATAAPPQVDPTYIDHAIGAAWALATRTLQSAA